MSLTPRQSLREEIARTLRASIIGGRLRPGTVYSVPTLAGEFGVSPTPVREAVLDLAKEGLVCIAKNKGFRVSAPSDAELDQITEIRTYLEVPAVSSLTGRLTAKQVTALRAAAKRIVDAAKRADITAYLEADTDFHTTLLGYSGNPLLVELVTDLRNRTRLYGLDSLVHNGGLAGSAAEHLKLVDELTNGTADRVADLMRHHLGHVRGIWAGTPAAR